MNWLGWGEEGASSPTRSDSEKCQQKSSESLQEGPETLKEAITKSLVQQRVPSFWNTFFSPTITVDCFLEEDNYEGVFKVLNELGEYQLLDKYFNSFLSVPNSNFRRSEYYDTIYNDAISGEFVAINALINCYNNLLTSNSKLINESTKYFVICIILGLIATEFAFNLLKFDENVEKLKKSKEAIFSKYKGYLKELLSQKRIGDKVSSQDYYQKYYEKVRKTVTYTFITEHKDGFKKASPLWLRTVKIDSYGNISFGTQLQEEVILKCKKELNQKKGDVDSQDVNELQQSIILESSLIVENYLPQKKDSYQEAIDILDVAIEALNVDIKEFLAN